MCRDPALRMLVTSTREQEGAGSRAQGGITMTTKVNYWAVLVAAVTALVTSAAWYIVFGSAWRERKATSQPGWAKNA
jgi:hypothetical protein